jgi:serine/threonine protein kinase/tetratricopeptide (TPR) repeat protein
LNDRWAHLNDIFHNASRMDGEARAAYLGDACGGDEALRHEVDELLRANESASRFLDAQALDSLSPPRAREMVSSVGRRFGAYRVVGEIGRGGMGAVFLAERADGQFEQRVAIKLIKRGMDTAQVLERFRVERQILASLDHPNIARLLDGGTTDDGLPYFVMEYIEGQPVDEYVNARHLTIRQRLELFLQICHAVSYAHQHLIVHRDIKPQNVLVTKGGVPKLLDFGIAKVLQDAGEQAPATIAGYQLLTPDYASPEQVEGHPTTTLSDVYSLGVVLYELLTGLSPYRPRTWNVSDVCESVRSDHVERPSTAVGRRDDERTTAGQRVMAADVARAAGTGSIDRLRGQLRGDLDAIVLTALRKEPERRYPSVEQFASDIQRHLAGLPVRARADSVWYRGAKFVRRNRVAVLAAVLVAVALVGGTIATAWQAREARSQARLAQDARARAERRFAEVRKLANALLFDYHDAIKDLPGSTPVRARLVRDALDHLNRLAAEAGGEPSLQRELALAYRKVAQVQGGVSGFGLGDTSGAIESHRKSLAILESLLAANPGDTRLQRDVADGALQLANVVGVTEDQADALAHARRARTLYEPLVSASAPTLDDRLALANAYDVIGTISLESGKADEALDTYRRQLRLLESASPAEQGEVRLRRALSIAHQHTADAQATFGDLRAALENIRTSLEIRLALSKESPLNTDYRALVSVAYYYEGDTLARLGRPREALESFRRNLAITEELAVADPKGANITFSAMRVGNMLAQLGEYDQALDYYGRALAIFVELVKADPSNLWKRGGLIEAHASTCAAYARLARHDAARTSCAEATRLIEQTKVEPTNAIIRASLARSYTAMAGGYLGLSRDARSSPAQQLAYLRSARDLYAKSVAIWADMRALGMLTSHDEEEAAAVSRALAETEAVLRSRGSGRAHVAVRWNNPSTRVGSAPRGGSLRALPASRSCPLARPHRGPPSSDDRPQSRNAP